jgi:DNA-binding transcriptional MocR family regulator
MNREAANSLLKTLEEPTEGTTLILLSHHGARLPITIRSRCQRWRIEHPPREEALAWLAREGLSAETAVKALDGAAMDPQRALQLAQDGFFDRQQAFEQQLRAFLDGAIDAATLVQQQKELDNEDWRRLLQNSILRALRMQVTEDCDEDCKQRLRRLLELQARSQRPLQVEETNLNLQLQLEDLLISLKQAIHRG